jgi:hypothetical protein
MWQYTNYPETLLHSYDHIMDEMCIAILQPDKVTFDRVRLRAFRREETSTFHTLTCNLVANGFSD